MLLIVHGSQRDQQVVVRFDGCDYHGTDDGQVERQLTTDVVHRLGIGLNRGPNRAYYGLSKPVVDLDK